MGSICSSNASKPQKVYKNQSSQLKQNENDSQQAVAYPQSKYALSHPTALKICQVTLISVPEDIAYNFLVKQGALRQRNKPPDWDGILLYGEQEDDLVTKYQPLGLLPIKFGNENVIFEDDKAARVLFNFKQIWIFKDKQFDNKWIENLNKKFQQLQVKPKQFNYLSQSISVLNEHFNICGKEFSVIDRFFPLKLYSSADIQADQTKNNIKDDGLNVFIHGSNQTEKIVESAINLYNISLQIRNILFMYEVTDIKMIKSLETAFYKVDVMKLKNNDGKLNSDIINKQFIPILNKLKITNSSVLLVYDSTQPNSFDIVKDVLTDYLARDQLIHMNDIQKYIEARKNISIQPIQHVESQINSKIDNKFEIIEEQPQLNRWEEIKLSYLNLTKRTKSPLAATSMHQTMLKLLEKIIENPSDPKFKQFQSTNKIIQLNILQYPEGGQVLQLCGFMPQIQDNLQVYVNLLEVGMLKLCRGDLELAFRKSQEE